MSVETKLFAIFRSPDQAESAVHRLADLGVDLRSIAVLHPRNEDTRDFANRQGTMCPAGTAEGLTAALPLNGTLGLLRPMTGPVEGALSTALADMGVPANWCDFRVVNGSILVSVPCNADSHQWIHGILRDAGARDLGQSVI